MITSIKICISNLAELLGRRFRPGEVAVIVLRLSGEGIEHCEVVAEWEPGAFELIGDVRRTVLMDKDSPEEHELIWEFTSQPGKASGESLILFWATSGELKQAAQVVLTS